MDGAITLPHLVALASIASVAFAIANSTVKTFVSYLSLKFGKNEIGVTTADQMRQCRFDHSEINKLIVTQNANIAEMLKQNSELIKVMGDANHAAQLRHQIVLSHLEQTNLRITGIHDLLNKR